MRTSIRKFYEIQQKCFAFLRLRQYCGWEVVNILVYTRCTHTYYIQIKITKETHSTKAKSI